MPSFTKHLPHLARLRDAIHADLHTFISEGQWELGVSPQEDFARFVADNCRPALALPRSTAFTLPQAHEDLNRSAAQASPQKKKH